MAMAAFFSVGRSPPADEDRYIQFSGFNILFDLLPVNNLLLYRSVSITVQEVHEMSLQTSGSCS